MSENQRFKIIRDELGLEQDQLGEIIDREQGTVSGIESGKSGVSKKVLNALRDKLNVNPEYIKQGKGPKFINNAKPNIEIYNKKNSNESNAKEGVMEPAPEYATKQELEDLKRQVDLSRKIDQAKEDLAAKIERMNEAIDEKISVILNEIKEIRGNMDQTDKNTVKLLEEHFKRLLTTKFPPKSPPDEESKQQ